MEFSQEVPFPVTAAASIEHGEEKVRADDVLTLVPQGRKTVLDLGSSDGHFSLRLTERFEHVTALDLQKPPVQHPRITAVAGDATRLQFADKSFDCVFCTEVLEHIPAVEQACREIQRVARHEIIIGVPYKQETRLGRTTCAKCGCTSPTYGHVNQFDEQRLAELFPGTRVTALSWAGESQDATNPLAVWLMDLAGNPWGSYGARQQCVHCSAALDARPKPLNLARKLGAGVSLRLSRLQSRFTKPHPSWIHVVLTPESQ